MAINKKERKEQMKTILSDTRKRAAIYIRYSSENQRDGYSVEYQQDECMKYIHDNGLLFVKSYVDEAVSGKSTNNRNAFFDMIADVKRGEYDCVVVYKYSRFARNLVEATFYRQQIEKAGAQLISAMERIDDSTPEGRMMRNIIMVMDEYYSDNLATFVQSAQYLAAKNGKIMGGAAPLGLKYNEMGTYDINEKEAPAIRLIFEMFAAGASQAAILRQLDNLGYVTRNGIPYKASTFAGLLTNVKYIGRYEIEITGYEKIVHDNAFPALIDIDTWNKVQLRLEKKRIEKEARPRLKKRSYPLTGKIVCTCCKHPYIGSAKGGIQNGVRVDYNYYVCKGKDDKRICTNKNVRKEKLEEYVFAQIRENLLNDRIIDQLAAETYNILASEDVPTAEDIKALRTEKRKIENKLEMLLDHFVEGAIPKSVLQRKTGAFTEQVSAIEKQLVRMEIAQASAVTLDKVKEHLKMLMYNLESGEPDLQKAVVDQTIHKIYVSESTVEVVLQINAESIVPTTDKALPLLTVERLRDNRDKI
jgi:site-specific DNA recombinase